MDRPLGPGKDWLYMSRSSRPTIIVATLFQYLSGLCFPCPKQGAWRWRPLNLVSRSCALEPRKSFTHVERPFLPAKLTADATSRKSAVKSRVWAGLAAEEDEEDEEDEEEEEDDEEEEPSPPLTAPFESHTSQPVHTNCV